MPRDNPEEHQSLVDRHTLRNRYGMSKRKVNGYGGGDAVGSKSARVQFGTGQVYDTLPKGNTQGQFPSRGSLRKTPEYKPDLKGMDTLIPTTNFVNDVGDADLIDVLNLIPPGTGSWQRVGKRVRMQSIRLKGYLSLKTPQTDGASTNINCARILIVYDKQPSGSQPIFSDMFGYTPQTGTEASLITSSIRYDNMGRFTILKEINICPVPGLGTTGGDTEQWIAIDEWVNLNNKETIYSGQSASQTIGDISSGALYLVSRSVVTTASMTMAWHLAVTRLRYYD